MPAPTRPAVLVSQAPPAAAADDGSNVLGGLTGMAFLRAVRRRWLLAFLVGLVLGAPAAAVAWNMIPQRHSASTLLRCESNYEGLLFDTHESRVNYAYWQKSQAVLVRSRLVINSALNDPQVKNLPSVQQQADPVAWLQGMVTMDFGYSPEIMRIAITAEDPDDLIVLANAVTKAYMEEVVNRSEMDRQKRINMMQQLYDKYNGIAKNYKDRLDKANAAIAADEAKLNTTDRVFDQTVVQEYRAMLVQLKGELIRAKAKAWSVPDPTKIDASSVEDTQIEAEMAMDPIIAREAAKLAELNGVIADTLERSNKGDEEPEVKRLQAQADKSTEIIEKRKKGIRPAVIKDIVARMKTNAYQYKTSHEAETGYYKNLEKLLLEQIKELQEILDRIGGGQTPDTEAMSKEFYKAQSVASAAESQLDMYKVESMAPSRVSELEKAERVEKESLNRKLKYAGAAGGGFFGLAFLGITFWEVRGRRLGGVDDVKNNLLGLRLVGTLPPLPGRMDRAGQARNAAESRGRQLFLESVDATRTLLLNTVKAESLRALMITSALSGEGKTSLSSHLAASLARVGCNTLLIDGDMRNPALHRLFGLPVGPGLSELLRGEAPLEEVVQETPVGGLWLLSAGQCDGVALQNLAQEKGRSLFADLKQRFDFVIVDSAPVLAVADSLLLGQYVDAVLFSLLHDVSRIPAVFAAYERIQTLGVRLLGAVVSGVRSEIYESTNKYSMAAKG